jgi:hypothetical protein
MSGISPTMLIAADGITSGSGLGVSANLTAALSSFNSSPLVQLYTDVRTALNGANVAVPDVPSYLNGKITSTSETSITVAVSSAAAAIAPDAKKFIANFAAADSFAQTSFTWLGAMSDMGTKTFESFGLGVTNFSEMVSGGAGKVFAAAEGAKADLNSLSSSLTKFGSAFDPSNLQKMFEPAGFIANLAKQGLGNVGGLSDALEAAGLDPKSLESANPEVVKQTLAKITGSDLEKIIAQTKISLPINHMVKTAADLLDAKKVLSPTELAAIPGGALSGLGNALTNMGGSFKSAADIAKNLAATKIPSLKHLDALPNPLPAGVMSSFASKMGSGGGPFGNPTISDIIGTAAGYKHTDAFTTLVNGHTAILASSQGQALQAAATALIADPTNSTKLSNFTAAQAAITGATDANLAKIVSDCSAAVTASSNQLITEATNQSKAGLVVSAAATPNTAQLLAFANKLPMYGIDKTQAGYNYILTNMATDDQYGEAIIASLSEGINAAKNALAGIASTTQSNAADALAKLQKS